MRVKLGLSYIGEEYNGWQIQPGLKTVQGELISAIKSLTGEEVTVTGSGRTDAGVHALGQVAHFDLSKDFEPKKIESGLNFYLPKSIRVLYAERVTDNFHARFSAKKKSYEYLFCLSDNALYLGRAYYRKDIDYAKMSECCSVFLGKHDFSAFKSLGSDTKTAEREIFEISLSQEGDFWKLKVTADGFLYNMVRKIVGALIKVGEGKLSRADLQNILDQKDNSASPVSPAYALYLQSVEY